MGTKIKQKALSLPIQVAKLKKEFPVSHIITKPHELIWKGCLTPTFWSSTYDVKLIYKKGCHPKVYIINQKLKLYSKMKTLPHVYDTEKQWLCLYFKNAREWKSTMFITDTIIPWTSEWLFHYEIWAGTGKWHGKGIHGKLKPDIH